MSIQYGTIHKSLDHPTSTIMQENSLENFSAGQANGDSLFQEYSPFVKFHTDISSHINYI